MRLNFGFKIQWGMAREGLLSGGINLTSCMTETLLVEIALVFYLSMREQSKCSRWRLWQTPPGQNDGLHEDPFSWNKYSLRGSRVKTRQINRSEEPWLRRKPCGEIRQQREIQSHQRWSVLEQEKIQRNLCRIVMVEGGLHNAAWLNPHVASEHVTLDNGLWMRTMNIWPQLL